MSRALILIGLLSGIARGQSSPNSITFDTIPNQILGVSPFPIAAQASSLLPVTFSSTNTSVCTVADNLVTLLTTGTCSITANQPGNSTYVAANAVTNSFTVSQASTSNAFVPSANSPFATPAPRALAVGDFNGDGKPDLAVANISLTGNNTVTILLGDGTGNFTAAKNSPFTVGGANSIPDAIAVGDFNGDGNQDLAVANQQTNRVVILLGDGTGNFSEAAGSPIQVGSGPYSIVVGDFNNDGIQDLATANYFDTGLTVLLGNGSGGFTQSSSSGLAVGAAAYLAIADFDGNGNEDIAATLVNSPGVAILLGDGSGGFTAASGSPITTASALEQIAVGDFNGDTVPDLAATSFSGNTVTVLLGNGSGGFNQPTGSPFSVGTSPWGIVVADFNGDGIQDLAITTESELSNGSLTVLLGNGSGGFTPAPQGSFPLNGAQEIVVSDFNLDGIEDVAIDDNPDGLVQVLLGAENGSSSQSITFTPQTPISYTASPISISASASSGLTVTFVSASPLVCSVSGTQVSLNRAGSCSIIAIQPGNASYAAATPVTGVIVVNSLSQTINFGSLNNVTYGVSPFTVSATVNSPLTVTFSSSTPAVCSVSGTTVTILAAGGCTIAANQAGNNIYAAAATVTQGFTVGKASQTITFGELSSEAFGTTPPALGATASSGLTVAYTSNNISVCTVSGTAVTLLSIGTCSLTANQAGSTNYLAAASVTQTFAVTKGSQTITFGPLSNETKGTTPPPLSATASSGLAVTFTSTTKTICTVSGVNLTLVAGGTCSITASQAGSTNYNAATSVTQTFLVLLPQTITFTALSNQTVGAKPFIVKATASSDLTVTFASNSPSVCTVSGTTVTMIGGGTCSITASQAGNTTYAAATPVTQTFTVLLTQTITFGTLTTQTEGTTPPALSASASSGLTVSFASTTKTVCTVSGVNMTLLAGGTCTITASQSGNSVYAAAPNVTQSFTVLKTQTITFAALANQTLGAKPFAVKPTASSALAVTLTSNTESVCTVTGSTVTLVGGGTCSLTANQAGNTTYAAAPPVTQTFTVLLTQTITFDTPGNQILGTTPPALTASASSGLPVSYATNSKTICTVSGPNITLLAGGTCSITASQSGNSVYAAAANVTQTFIVLKTQTITFNAPANQVISEKTYTVKATSSSGLAVSFVSNTQTICTVSGTTVSLVAGGTCSLTANQAGNTTFAAATPVTQTFNVLLTQTINFISPGNQAQGSGPVTLSATASSNLPVSFASTTPTICTVLGATATLIAGGKCSITASQAGDGVVYAAAPNVTQSFLILAAQTITFSPLSNEPVGNPVTLQATATSGLTVSFASTTTTICTVSGTKLTLLQGGTCSITASQAGNSTYAPAQNIIQSFTVLATQTISFGTLSNQTQGTTPPALSATASSGLTVSFASTTLSVCTVSGTTITLITSGTCSITASQSGNGTYAAAPNVTQSFTVLKSQTISFTQPANTAVGTPVTLQATATSGLTVSFASTTTSICTVSGTTATLLQGGTCSITASQAGNSTYGAAPQVTQSFTVLATQTITFGTLSNQTQGTTPPALSATASSGLTVSFASTTLSVCTVSGVNITLIAGGTCSITASQSGNGTYAAAPNVTQSFTVLESQTISFTQPANTAVGTPVTLQATATSGLTVSFASTTTSICTVSGTTATLLQGGTCSITASQAGNSTYGAAPNVSQSFTVLATQTITFGTLSNQTQGTTPPALSATASSGLTVSFASTTLSVCTVSGTTITLITSGTCSITASQSGNGTYAAAPNVTQSFTVLKSQTISFTQPANTAVGTPVTLQATATSGLTVSFASTTTSICTVSGTTATLLQGGTCSITASQAGNSTYGAAPQVTQSFTVLATQTITFGTLSNQTQGTTPPALSATASSGLTVTFASTTPSVCTVSGVNITLVSSGTCSITASQSGNGTYAAAPNVTQSFTVLKSQTISFTQPPTTGVGTPVTLQATATSGLTVSFASTTTSICTVSGTTATLLQTGTCSITASQAGNSTYGAAPQVTQSFTVLQSQTITFGSLSNQAQGSTPPPLSATASSGLTVTFASTTPAVCTVSGVNITLVGGGQCSITASQAGNSTYAPAPNVTQSFLVLGQQTITFNPPATQGLGQVSSVALTATASSGLAVSYTSNSTSVCTISGSSVNLVYFGTCSITASQAGNSSWAPATSVTQTFQIEQAQTILFSSLPNGILGQTPPALNVPASSLLVVTLTSNTPSVCTFSGNTTVNLPRNSTATLTLVGLGTCSITATQPGNSTYAPAPPITQTFNVYEAQTISFPPIANQPLGEAPFQLEATSSSGLTVSFASNNTAVCTVSGATVTLIALGDCTITASQAGTSLYEAAPTVSHGFFVGKPQTISFGTLSNQQLATGSITVSATSSSGLAVTSFTSNSPAVCTVSGDTVTFVDAGTCSISANQAGGNVAGTLYAPAPTVTQTFVISGQESINFDTIPTQIMGISPFPIVAEASSGLPVTFASQTTSVCQTVADMVVLIQAGTCTISASQAGNGNFLSASVNQSFTITQANAAAAMNATTASPISSAGINALATADFNNDGVPDLVIANTSAITLNTISVLLGNGSGGFSTATGSPVAVGDANSTPDAIAVGDFNGDGNMDLAVANQQSGNVVVLLGNGSGGFTAATGSPITVGAGPQSIVVGDFNGDGILDLAVANYSGNSITVLLGNGSGGFTQASGSPISTSSPAYLAVADFNSDGNLDLAVVTQATSSTITVFVGDGTGKFAAPTPFPIGSSLPGAPAVGDFNQDGIPDLAVATTAGQVFVLLGTGSAGFTQATGSPFTAGSSATSPGFVAVADFNGDGIQDLAVTNFGGGTVTILLGAGGGASAGTPLFSAASFSPLSVGTGPQPISVADFNGDGIEDVAVANETAGSITVLLGSATQ